MLDCFKGLHAIAFVGEYGSGKTELSVNLALDLAKDPKNKVCFFDMDQTKPTFRSRDFEGVMLKSGVQFNESYEFWDAPVVPYGISTALDDPDTICIFDVGGNAVGARMIGQYFRYFENGRYFYIVNPYRPFSGMGEDLEDSVHWIGNAGRITWEKLFFVSNPTLGPETDAKIVLDGHAILKAELAKFGKEPTLLMADRKLINDITGSVDCPIYPINPYVRPLYH